MLSQLGQARRGSIGAGRRETIVSPTTTIHKVSAASVAISERNTNAHMTKQQKNQHLGFRGYAFGFEVAGSDSPVVERLRYRRMRAPGLQPLRVLSTLAHTTCWQNSGIYVASFSFRPAGKAASATSSFHRCVRQPLTDGPLKAHHTTQ